MIIKQRTSNNEYFILDALKRRLPSSHPSYNNISNRIASLEAGIWGENSVKAKLQNFYPPFKFFVLHDIQLQSVEFFQIDHLIITPHYFLIIESKNLKDDIEITRNPDQMIQFFSNGTRKTYDSPIAQVERNVMWLENWLHERNIRIPIYGLVAFTNTNCHIKTSQEEPSICRTKDINKKILQLPRDELFLSEEEMNQIAAVILKNHRQHNKSDLLNYYEVVVNEIITGVQCLSCGRFEMTWRKRFGIWECVCGNKCENAHERALEDYRYIIGDEMTNKQCRQFLHLHTRNTAQRLLVKSNYIQVGERVNCKYKFNGLKKSNEK